MAAFSLLAAISASGEPGYLSMTVSMSTLNSLIAPSFSKEKPSLSVAAADLSAFGYFFTTLSNSSIARS